MRFYIFVFILIVFKGTSLFAQSLGETNPTERPCEDNSNNSFVLIGIGDYKNHRSKDLPNLSSSNKDLINLYTFLINDGCIPKERIRILGDGLSLRSLPGFEEASKELGRHLIHKYIESSFIGWFFTFSSNNLNKKDSPLATKHNILAAIGDLINKNPSTKNIIIYFSGHGELITTDNANMLLWKKTEKINSTEIKSWYKKSLKRNILLWVDACGKFWGKDIHTYKGSHVEIWAPSIISKGKYQTKTQSFEKGSIFTYSLIETFREKMRKRKYISWKEEKVKIGIDAFADVNKKMRSITENLSQKNKKIKRHELHKLLGSNLTGELSIFLFTPMKWGFSVNFPNERGGKVVVNKRTLKPPNKDVTFVNIFFYDALSKKFTIIFKSETCDLEIAKELTQKKIADEIKGPLFLSCVTQSKPIKMLQFKFEFEEQQNDSATIIINKNTNKQFLPNHPITINMKDSYYFSITIKEKKGAGTCLLETKKTLSPKELFKHLLKRKYQEGKGYYFVYPIPSCQPKAQSIFRRPKRNKQTTQTLLIRAEEIYSKGNKEGALQEYFNLCYNKKDNIGCLRAGLILEELSRAQIESNKLFELSCKYKNISGCCRTGWNHLKTYFALENLSLNLPTEYLLNLPIEYLLEYLFRKSKEYFSRAKRILVNKQVPNSSVTAGACAYNGLALIAIREFEKNKNCKMYNEAMKNYKESCKKLRNSRGCFELAEKHWKEKLFQPCNVRTTNAQYKKNYEAILEKACNSNLGGYCFNKSCEEYKGKACLILGAMLEREKKYFYKKACDKPLLYCYHLAHYYEKNENSLFSSIKKYELSCKMSLTQKKGIFYRKWNIRSCGRVGYLFLKGKKTIRDEGKGIYFLKRACSTFGDACIHIAEYYSRKGRCRQAKHYYNKASKYAKFNRRIHRGKCNILNPISWIALVSIIGGVSSAVSLNIPNGRIKLPVFTLSLGITLSFASWAIWDLMNKFNTGLFLPILTSLTTITPYIINIISSFSMNDPSIATPLGVASIVGAAIHLTISTIFYFFYTNKHIDTNISTFYPDSIIKTKNMGFTFLVYDGFLGIALKGFF